jgi:cell division protein FtsI/penicillin-binding protein 2
MTRTFLVAAAALLGAAPAARAERPALRFDTLQLVGDRYVASTEDGEPVALTLDPRMQEAADGVLKAFRVPYGGAVVLSVADGRVLALVGRSSADQQLGAEELALRPWAPAASVFKVVSATALVEGGLSGATRTCYHGGTSAILPDNLLDLPLVDRRCDTLAYGLGKSQNAILAKLAARHLTAGDLARAGHDFGFDREIPFELPVQPSHLDVPTDALEFARTAAGFWHSTLSPLHGALVAATIASGGRMPSPTLVARAAAAPASTAAAARRVMARAVAREVGRMMELTTRIGTARAAFHDRRGRRLLACEVAGKTGTLSAITDHGFVGYSWFVGYAPADHPAIAFAVALGNNPGWRIKASYVARRIVAEYLAEKGERAAPSSAGNHLLAAR